MGKNKILYIKLHGRTKKKKVSKSKRNSRRAHDKINKVSIAFDSVTKEPKLTHHLSLKDGYYNGKQFVIPKSKVNDQQTTELGKKEKVSSKNQLIKTEED